MTGEARRRGRGAAADGVMVTVRPWAQEAAGLVLVGAAGADDSGERPDAVLVRARTAELMTHLADAGPGERQAIRDEVITLHLPMAAAAARRYRSAEAEDLRQVACAGLVEAFDRFDPAQASYAHFAWVTMHGLLRRHLRDHGWVVRPIRSSQEAALVLRRSEPELTQRLGRTPTQADLAAALGWTAAEVDAARRAQQVMSAASLDALGEAGGLVEADEARLAEARAVLHGPLRQLDDADRELVRLRFVDELTQTEIARLLGVSQMQVSRALARLMTQLRTLIGDLTDDGVAGAA